MALRDHSLDGRITAAAREEFLDKSYTGASLRKIAEKAGVTVGAIQTRCKTKDALFCSLLKPLLADIGALFQSTRADYAAGAEGDLLSGLRASMERESAAILRLIFDHYDEAVLLLCRSGGSSLEGPLTASSKARSGKAPRFSGKRGGPWTKPCWGC